MDDKGLMGKSKFKSENCSAIFNLLAFANFLFLFLRLLHSSVARSSEIMAKKILKVSAVDSECLLYEEEGKARELSAGGD
jgi:hypothetical protein